MKFDLMYYLGMNQNDLMTLDLAELRWYYERLREVKAMEQEIEKVKLEATMAAVGAGAVRKQMGSLVGEG